MRDFALLPLFAALAIRSSSRYVWVMIHADMHLHTCYSHGRHTPFEMHLAATRKGLELMGFSEHSPRPPGYDYLHEYREQLRLYLPRYIAEVRKLQARARELAAGGRRSCQVLLGLEMDWLSGQEDFIRKAIAFGDYDYVIGSVHFLGKWGFDDGKKPWLNISQEVCEQRYEDYFLAWREMIDSGFFQIAAHPDLIKIFSVSQFKAWLRRPHARELVCHCLEALKGAGMAMEISSAGLRKDCQEIYPCPEIMGMARDLSLPISIASDAHCMADVGFGFEELAAYARSFGFEKQTIFDRGQEMELDI